MIIHRGIKEAGQKNRKVKSKGNTIKQAEVI